MQYRSVWVFIGWAMVALGIGISLFPAQISHIGLDNNGKDIHVVAYFAFMLWLGQLYPLHSERIAIAIGLVLMGLGLEGLQELQGTRSGTWPDAAANVAGVGCGWLALKTRLSEGVSWLDGKVSAAVRLLRS